MRIINKTDTTLIFSDISLVLTYDPERKGIEIDDLDLKSSPSLMGYIDKGKVEVADEDKGNLMYKRIENRNVLAEKKISGAKKLARAGGESRPQKEENILGGESKIFSHKNKVHTASRDSAIEKFRETGEMDLAYYGPCFSAGAIVLTSDGVKRISEVNVGDKVLTHLGNWKKVTEIFKTKYGSALTNIDVGLQNGIFIRCTPNHRFYTSEEWVEANLLEPDSMLHVPISPFERPDKYLRIYDLIDIQKDNFVSVCSMDSGEIDLVYMYLFCGKKNKDGYVEFVSDASDAMKIASIAKQMHCYDQSSSISEGKVETVVESRDLTVLLDAMCGDEDRRIPSIFFREKMDAKFLTLLFSNQTKNSNGSVTIYTKHELVGWGIVALLLRFGVFASIQYVPKRNYYCVTAIISSESRLHEDGIVGSDLVSEMSRKSKAYRIEEGRALVQCYGCTIGGEEDYVYNLEVADDNSYTVNLVAAHNCHDAGGYAKMNRKYILGLSEREGINMYLKNMSSKRDIEEEIIEKLDECEDRSVGPDCPMIHGCTAPTFRWAGHKILYTMMETEVVHPQYIEKCNMANEVWLPSEWCIEKFRESGLVADVYKMPIGVDFDLYKEGKEPLDFGGKLKGFTFISVFGWSLRKCYDIMLRAFVEEFSSLDDVTYLVCSRFAGGTDEVRKDMCRNEIRSISTSIRKSHRPNIVYFGDVMPEKLMGNLYNTAHCYLGLSRGEGFGLPWMEGSMCGLPVIGSNYSALTDFLNEENSFLVDPECVRPQKEIEWISYYYQGMPVADYGRAAIDQTRRYMRYVYENYGKAKEKNRKLQKFIRENYDWEKCIDTMYGRVKDLYPTLKHRGEK